MRRESTRNPVQEWLKSNKGPSGELLIDGRDFAAKIGISQSHLSEFFSGYRGLKPAVLLKVSEQTGLSEHLLLQWLSQNLRGRPGERNASPDPAPPRARPSLRRKQPRLEVAPSHRRTSEGAGCPHADEQAAEDPTPGSWCRRLPANHGGPHPGGAMSKLREAIERWISGMGPARGC